MWRFDLCYLEELLVSGPAMGVGMEGVLYASKLAWHDLLE